MSEIFWTRRNRIKPVKGVREMVSRAERVGVVQTASGSGGSGGDGGKRIKISLAEEVLSRPMTLKCSANRCKSYANPPIPSANAWTTSAKIWRR